MSAFYQINGSVRLRKCEEVAAAIAALREGVTSDFELDEEDDGDGVVRLTVGGGGQVPGASILDFDEALIGMGRHAVEAAVFAYRYEDESGFFGVGPTLEAVRAAESAYALEEVIMPEVGSLTVEDASKLVARIVEAVAGLPREGATFGG